MSAFSRAKKLKIDDRKTRFDKKTCIYVIQCDMKEKIDQIGL